MSDRSRPLAPSSPTLVRAIGRWDLAALNINNTIGAGILGLPGPLYALLGIWSLAACLGGGLVIALVAACFAEAGSRFTRTGGVILYAGAAFGPAAAFTTGWLTILKVLLSYATVMNLAIGYAAALVPALASGAPRLVAITAVTLALTLPIYRGVQLSVWAHNAFTVCKLGLLLGFVALALPTLLRHGVPITQFPPRANFPAAILLLVFAMGGLESTGTSAAETRNPARDIPFGLTIGTACVVVLYALVLLSCQATVPDLTQTQRPLFDAAQRLAGPAGGTMIVVTGVISMAGVMFVNLFVAPRFLLSLAESGMAPGALARIDPRYQTPAIATLLSSGVALVLCIATSFLGALTASSLIRLLIYAMTAACVLRLRARRIDETGNPLLLPGGKAIATTVAILCLALILVSKPAEIRTLAATVMPLAAIGVIIQAKTKMSPPRE